MKRDKRLEAMEILGTKYGMQCVRCGSEDDLTIDHIVRSPVGSDEISNLQILCRVCNSKKRWRNDLQYRQNRTLTENDILFERLEFIRYWEDENGEAVMTGADVWDDTYWITKDDVLNSKPLPDDWESPF